MQYLGACCVDTLEHDKENREQIQMKYTMEARVRYSETGMDERLTLDGVLKYFQDCAVFHSEDVGSGMNELKEKHLVWYLSSWQICIGEYPKVCEQIKVSTWPYAFHQMMGDRNHTLENADGTVLAWGNSNWVLMDTRKQRPVPVPAELGESYGLEEKYPMDYAPRKIKIPEGGEKREPLQITQAHLDSNLHVNNTQYIRIAEEYIPEDFTIHQLRAEYKMQARKGDLLIPTVVLHDGEWIVSLENDQGRPYAVVAFS